MIPYPHVGPRVYSFIASDVALRHATDIATIVGNVALVLTLGFLGWQLRASRHATAHVSAMTQTSTLTSLYWTLFKDPTLAELYTRGRDEPEKLSPDEKKRFFYACTTMFTYYENLYMACQSKLMPKDYFESWDPALREDLADAGFQEYWSLESQFYDKEFREYVNTVLDSLPHAEPGAQ